jgi:4-hydroxy-3-methylbut-2-enyl diphosphate reductase IspH
MPYFRFFKKDENCRWLRKEILEHYPEYLYGPVDHEGKPVRFHVILDWVMRENRGANAQWVKEIGGNVVQSAKDVPAGDGVFITGYDCDIEERRDLENRGVPIVDRACPWVKEFRDQLLALDPSTHQAVVMIDEGHMVYQCYRSIIPADAILVQPEDFRERIERLHDGRRALKLIVYTVYRPKDAERVILYIEENRANGANDLRGYEKTLCVWTKQGLFEEMAALIPAERLGEVWIICSSDADRSTRSIINEVADQGAVPRVIREESEIPGSPADDARIGVLMAPIPMPKKALAIKETIRKRFGGE